MKVEIEILHIPYSWHKQFREVICEGFEIWLFKCVIKSYHRKKECRMIPAIIAIISSQCSKTQWIRKWKWHFEKQSWKFWMSNFLWKLCHSELLVPFARLNVLICNFLVRVRDWRTILFFYRMVASADACSERRKLADFYLHMLSRYDIIL